MRQLAAIAERRIVVLLLSIVLIASGTPQVVARDTAQRELTARAQQAALEARLDPGDDDQSTGTPPDPDEMQALTAPVASGVNPPYPVNHTLDAGYHGQPLTEWLRLLGGWTLEIVRGVTNREGVRVEPKRWIT